MPKLTRTQLYALTDLHQHGRQDVRSRSPRLRSLYATETERYSSSTLQALVTAGVARWSHGNTLTATRVEPVVNVYADASGAWHVEVPATVPAPDRAAVARAVILGEVWRRSGYRDQHGNPWRPRVVANGDNGDPGDDATLATGDPGGAPVPATLFYFREV